MWRMQDGICLPDNYGKNADTLKSSTCYLSQQFGIFIKLTTVQTDPHCCNTDIFILLTATSKPTAITEYVLLRFHGKNGYANASQYNVVCTLSIFWNTTEAKVQRFNILNIYFTLWLVQCKFFACWYYLSSCLTEDTLLFHYKKHTVNVISMFTVRIKGDIYIDIIYGQYARFVTVGVGGTQS